MAKLIIKDKGFGFIDLLLSQGLTLEKKDGNWVCPDDQAEQIQGIYTKYDPLDLYQREAIEKINTAAGKARTKYVTDIPFQSDAYHAKLSDAKAFKVAGYPEAELTSYPYVAARAKRENVTGEQAANDTINIAKMTELIQFSIENLRDTTIAEIKQEKDWHKCAEIADVAMAQMDNI